MAVPAAGFWGLFGGGENVEAREGMVEIAADDLAAGEARHYQFRDGKTLIRFFVVRDKQGTLRAALDACEVCWREDKGYKLHNGGMLCVNCGQVFALNRIGLVRGGCNPHPVVFAVEANKVRIAASELVAGAGYFPANRS